MRNLGRLWLLTGCVLVIVGPGCKDQTTKNERPTAKPEAGAIKAVRVKGLICLRKLPSEKLFVVKTQAALDALVKTHGVGCEPKLPNVDFAKELLLGVMLTDLACSISTKSEVTMRGGQVLLHATVVSHGVCKNTVGGAEWLRITKPSGSPTFRLKITPDAGSYKDFKGRGYLLHLKSLPDKKAK